MGFMLSIECAWDRGWHTLWMELDSIAVTQLVNSKSLKVPWYLRTKWVNCLYLLSHMEHKASHIFREGNTAADRIANYAIHLSSVITWWSSAPTFVQNDLIHDLQSLPAYRFREFGCSSDFPKVSRSK